MPLGQQPAPGEPQQGGADKEGGAGRTSTHRNSSRAVRAWVRVTPSTYSSSPPTGRPRASRETFTPASRGQQLLEVGRRRLPLQRGVGGEDHLAHLSGRRAVAPAGRSAAPPGRSRRAARAGRRAPRSARERPRPFSRIASAEASSTTQRSVASRRGSRQMGQTAILGRLAALGAGVHPLRDHLQPAAASASSVRAAAAADGRRGAGRSSGPRREAARTRR